LKGLRSRALPGLLLATVFLGALVYATLRESGVRCEACVDFEGARACRSVAAADREQAVDQAVATACAVLARGVTEAFACQRSVPSSLHCDD
jgi:hypothetical protein